MFTKKNLFKQARVGLLLIIFISCDDLLTNELVPTPTASFTPSSSQTIKVGESVNFSSTSSDADELLWTFEGGTPSTSTSSNPQVTYNEPGIYDVVLTATNEGGSDTDTEVSFIEVQDPEPASSFSASDRTIAPGESVDFSNNSTNAVRYEWTFEGGTPSSSTSENPSVTYNSAGSFSVTLKSFNSSDVEDTETIDDYITVDDPDPIASFTSSSQQIAAGSSVSFTNTSDNATRFEWTFDGGTPSTSTAENPSVTYNTPGTYNVSLVAFNGSNESDTETKSSHINVVAQPVANFSISNTTITEGDKISITNNSQNGDSYEWTFEGGTPSSSTNQNPGQITFNTEGNYDISLKVSNAIGNDTQTTSIQVNRSTVFDAKIQNYLYFDIDIFYNNTYIGRINARDNRTFTNLTRANSVGIRWELVRPVEVGVVFGGSFNLSDPSGEIGLEVDNVIGSNKYQYILLTNNEPYNIFSTVNPGSGSEVSSGNFFVPANAGATYLGYFLFVELDRQVNLYNNSGRTGTFWYITYNEPVVDDKSGRVDIVFDINGNWDTGTWNGSVSRSSREIPVDPNYRSDWEIKLKKADFSGSTMITEQDQ